MTNVDDVPNPDQSREEAKHLYTTLKESLRILNGELYEVMRQGNLRAIELKKLEFAQARGRVNDLGRQLGVAQAAGISDVDMANQQAYDKREVELLEQIAELHSQSDGSEPREQQKIANELMALRLQSAELKLAFLEKKPNRLWEDEKEIKQLQDTIDYLHQVLGEQPKNFDDGH